MQQKVQNYRAQYLKNGERQKLQERYAAEISPYVQQRAAEGNPVTDEELRNTPIGKIFTDLAGPPKKIEDVSAKSFVVCAERDLNEPSFDSRRATFWLQGIEDHNGIPSSCNEGDIRNVHALIKVSTPAPGPDDLQAKEHWGMGEPDFIEGRGGEVRDPKNNNELFPGTAAGNVSRVQPSAGNLAALTNGGNKVFSSSDSEFAAAMAMFSARMANGQIIYSRAELSSAAGGDHEMSPAAEKELVSICKDQEDGKQNWAINHVNAHPKQERGINCVSFAVRAGQVAMAHFLRERARSACNPDAGFESIMPEMKKLGGIFNANPKYVGVDSFEHLLLHTKGLDGQPLFAFNGKVQIEPKFEEKMPPVELPKLPALPDSPPEVTGPQRNLATPPKASL